MCFQYLFIFLLLLCYFKTVQWERSLSLSDKKKPELKRSSLPHNLLSSWSLSRDNSSSLRTIRRRTKPESGLFLFVHLQRSVNQKQVSCKIFGLFVSFFFSENLLIPAFEMYRFAAFPFLLMIVNEESLDFTLLTIGWCHFHKQWRGFLYLLNNQIILKTTAHVKTLSVKLPFKLYFAPQWCESIVSMWSVMRQQRELLH